MVSTGKEANYLDPRNLSSGEVLPVVAGKTGAIAAAKDSGRGFVVNLSKRMVDPLHIMTKKKRTRTRLALEIFLSIPLVAIGLGLALCLLVAFVLYKVLMMVLSSMLFVFEYTIMTIINNVVEALVSISVLFGGAWLFWELNPEFRQKVGQKVDSISGFFDSVAGIPLPHIPDFGDMMSWVRNSLGFNNFPTSLSEIAMHYDIPQQLEPLSDLKLSSETLQNYASALNAGDALKGFQKITPMLSSMLYDQNPDMRQAAMEALKRINSPAARDALRIYAEQIKRHGTGR